MVGLKLLLVAQTHYTPASSNDTVAWCQDCTDNENLDPVAMALSQYLIEFVAEVG